MKKNRWIWGILTGILCVILFCTRKSVFLVWIVLMAALPLVSALENWIALKKLKIALAFDGNGEKGSRVNGTVRVENQSRFGVPHLALSICMENQLNGMQKKRTEEMSIHGHTSDQIDLSFDAAHCGAIDIRIEDVWAWDIWEILGIRWKGQADTKVLVWPQMFAQQITLDGGEIQDLDAVEYAKERPGNDPGEMYDIREYQPGDRLSSIHWKLSGKLDQLMVVRPGQPLENSILLLFESNLDQLKTAESDSKYKEDVPARVDAAVTVFASICQNLLDDGFCFQVACMNEEEGRPVVCELADTNDLAGIFPRLLSSGYSGGGSCVLEQYLQMNGEMREAHCVCVSHQLPEGWQQLTDAYGCEVTLLVSDDTPAEALAEHIRKIGFSAQGYEDSLYDLSI